MPVEPPVSSCVLEDGSLPTTDGKTETTTNVAEVSQIASSVPVGATVQPIVALLTKAEIAALVVTRLRRYFQTMVWDIPMDETEYLNKYAITLILLDLAKAMSSREQTILDLEIELLSKTKNYSWRSIISLVNIFTIMKNIR